LSEIQKEEKGVWLLSWFRGVGRFKITFAPPHTHTYPLHHLFPQQQLNPFGFFLVTSVADFIPHPSLPACLPACLPFFFLILILFLLFLLGYW
jgi:hypothetical protein